MKNLKKQSGFALFQVLIIAILVFGMMYLFTKMNQTTQKQLDQKNSGKTAAIIMNSLLNATVNNDICTKERETPYQLKECIELSSTMQEKLKTMDMDPEQSTVTVKDELDL